MIDKSKVFKDNIGKTIDFWIFDRSEDSDMGYYGKIVDTDGYWVSILLGREGERQELHYFNISKISEFYLNPKYDSSNILEVKIKARSMEKVIKG